VVAAVDGGGENLVCKGASGNLPVMKLVKHKEKQNNLVATGPP